MRHRRRFVIVLLLIILAFVFLTQAAHWLVVDEPEMSDVIVVVAGETNARPSHALELLRQGFAPRAFFDAEPRVVVYDQRLTDIAQRYINSLPEAGRISVCPILGFSTFEEAADVSRCLEHLGAHRVLIVTSDFHTRRARMIFRHRLPQYQISVAAARAPAVFGDAWWTNREWAKETLNEWSKLLVYEAVDRWR